jgi:hypothetical protein
MALHIFLFLLVVCLHLTLALLWRLDWLHLLPSRSAVASRCSPVHRLLKPRSPLFTSDGLNLYFYALTAHFGTWREERVEGATCADGRWQRA